MSELAFNINGERFDLPANASCWRVRRFKASGRGTPEVIFGDDGLPLIIPIETEIGEFRSLVANVPGRYRLDPLDDNQKACEGGIAAYIQLSGGPAAGQDASHQGGGSSAHDDLLRELVRANTEMVKTIAEKFATVMDSAATLLRAADGAGMPAREPTLPSEPVAALRNAGPAPVEEEENDDDDEPEPQGNQLRQVLETMAAQALPLLTQYFYSKMMAVSREQAPPVAPKPASQATSPATEPAAPKTPKPTAEPEANVPPPAATAAPPAAEAPTKAASRPQNQTAAFLMHLMQVEQRLTPPEVSVARQAIRQMSPEAQAAWRERLLQLTPDQAAELIRKEIQRIAPDQAGASLAAAVKGAA